MNKPIYTWPFLLVYKLVIFPFNVIKYFFLCIKYILLALFKKKNKPKKINNNKIAEAEQKKQELIIKKQEEKERILAEKRKKQEAIQAKKNEEREKKLAKKRETQEKKLEQAKQKMAEKAKLELEKKEKKEAELIRRMEEAELKKKQKQEAIEKKKQKKQEKHEARKKRGQKDEYVNENVSIEKESINDKVSKFSEQFLKFPSKIKQKIIERYNNSTFVKNRKNKLDMERQALLVNFDEEDEVKSNVKVLYEYVAKNPEGKVIKGYFDAFSKVEVHSYLLGEGYEVYSIRTSKWIQMMHSNVSTNKLKIKHKDIIFFSTQLSTYIKAGIPLVDALKILVRQFNNKKYKKIFNTMVYDLTTGDNFSEAMEKQGEAFPKIFINMVKASEMTGELPEALDDMSDYFTETEKTRKAMITAMMYPSIIFVFAIGVSAFIMMYVVPQFYEIFASMDDAEIPKLTQFVMNFSKFLTSNGLWVLIGIIVFVFTFIFLYKNNKFFKTVIQYVLMRMPVFGNVVIYNEVTMFTKTFASLLKHNVFITDSMDILNKMTNNQIYKMLILDTITNLAKGEKISAAFKNQWAFPIPAYEMLVTGEETGQLAEMMEKVAEYYQDLHGNAVTRIKTFIEPVMIVFLTVIVGVIVLSIVIPMFSMYSNLG